MGRAHVGGRGSHPLDRGGHAHVRVRQPPPGAGSPGAGHGLRPEGARSPPARRAIGLNWINLHADSDTIVWHNGGTGGYRTFAGFISSKKIGVVVLTNSGGAGADDIGMHLLRPELPLAPAPQPRKVFTAIEVPAAVLATYVGT